MRDRELARRVRAAAAELHQALARQSVHTWVQPLVASGQSPTNGHF
ncbi:MAG: hypothetical protein JO304_13100 [Solirubrobacterales bacterium]|nr:hypothetical protein [Solirubrobacterales bacterium]